MKLEIPLKALSVNNAWQGRRFKSNLYKKFEIDVCKFVRECRSMMMGPVEVSYTFYIKNYSLTDIDNLIKPLQDIIVKRGYIEDDRKIIFMTAEKIKSKEERIEVEIRKYEVMEENL